MSLRIRLTLIIASLMTLLVVADSIRRLHDAHDDAVAEMESVARLAHALLPGTLSPPPVGMTAEALLAGIRLTDELHNLRHLAVEVRALNGNLILSSRSGPQRAPPVALGWMGERLLSRAPLRKDILVGSEAIGYYQLVPNADDELREIWNDYVEQTSMVVAIGVIACLMVFWAAGRALRPLGSVMRALSAIGDGRLDARLDNFGPGDLAPLSESFNRMASTLEVAVSERGRLLRKLITHEEETRHSLARDLHDELTPYLVAIQPHLRLLANACEGHPELVDHRESTRWVSEQVGHLLRLVRNLLEHLRPPDIEALGLEHALNELGRQRSRCADGPRVTFDLAPDLGQLSPTHQITLYRIIQECLTNTIKHARCTHIEVRLDMDRACGRVSLLVLDDGEPLASVPSVGGFGLLGMRERAMALGGDCQASPRNEGGWRVSAWLPLKTAVPENP